MEVPSSFAGASRKGRDLETTFRDVGVGGREGVRKDEVRERREERRIRRSIFCGGEGGGGEVRGRTGELKVNPLL